MPEKGHLPSTGSQNDDSGDDSRDDGKRASESSESSGRLPSQEPSQEEPSDSGRLPSQEKREETHGEGPSSPPSGAPGSETPPPLPSEGPAEAGTRSERIQRAINAGGLDGLPEDFGNPDDGGWQIARSEDPFERLYLDHHRHEEITSEMVRGHFKLIRSFWKQKVRTLDTGAKQQARQIRRKYGGPHNDGDVVRGHLEKTKQAYGELKDAEGRERWYRKLEEARREEGHEALRPKLEMALRDGVLEPPEVEGLFDTGCEVGLREEEVADFIGERLKADGFGPVEEPEGETFADRLRSVRWMTPEEHQKLEGERESARSEKKRTSTGTASAGTPELEVEETRIQYEDLELGATRQGSITFSNVGGGNLKGSLKAEGGAWLSIDRTSIDPSQHRQRVSYRVDTSNLAYGSSLEASIKISSNGGDDAIPVSVSVETPEKVSNRWAARVALCGLPLGAIFGLLVPIIPIPTLGDASAIILPFYPQLALSLIGIVLISLDVLVGNDLSFVSTCGGGIIVLCSISVPGVFLMLHSGDLSLSGTSSLSSDEQLYMSLISWVSLFAISGAITGKAWIPVKSRGGSLWLFSVGVWGVVVLILSLIGGSFAGNACPDYENCHQKMREADVFNWASDLIGSKGERLSRRERSMIVTTTNPSLRRGTERSVPRVTVMSEGGRSSRSASCVDF